MNAHENMQGYMQPEVQDLALKGAALDAAAKAQYSNFTPMPVQYLNSTNFNVDVRSLTMPEFTRFSKIQKGIDLIKFFAIATSVGRCEMIPFIDFFNVAFFIRQLTFNKKEFGFSLTCDNEECRQTDTKVLDFEHLVKPKFALPTEPFDEEITNIAGEKCVITFGPAMTSSMITDTVLEDIMEYLGAHIYAINGTDHRFTDPTVKKEILMRHFSTAESYYWFRKLGEGYCYSDLGFVRWECSACKKRQEAQLFQLDSFFAPELIKNI